MLDTDKMMSDTFLLNEREIITKLFSIVIARCSSNSVILVEQICDELINFTSFVIKKRKYELLLKIIEKKINSRIRTINNEEEYLVKKAIIFKLASEINTMIVRNHLPDSIISLYSHSMKRLINSSKENLNNNYYDNYDFFIKDLGFILGLLIPCNSCIMSDPDSYILIRSLVRSIFRKGNLRFIYKTYFKGGLGPWLRYHVDERDLTDFNEIGWNKFYSRIAKLLKLNPSIKGIVGTSWFFDPQIIDVSPRLGYLQTTQLLNGAILIRHGSDINTIRNATIKSKIRRELYEKGKYVPISFSIFWFRDDIIRWEKKFKF